jgi:hypothetical protein
MKLGLFFVALTILGAAACGGEGAIDVGVCDPDDAPCPGRSAGGGTIAPPVVNAGDAGRTANDAGTAEAGHGGDSGSNNGGSTSSGGYSSSGSTSGSGGGNGGGSSGGADAAGPETGGRPGICGPGNACGGLWACSDGCYTDKCCSLVCDCTDPSGQNGTLECTMTCP